MTQRLQICQKEGEPHKMQPYGALASQLGLGVSALSLAPRESTASRDCMERHDQDMHVAAPSIWRTLVRPGKFCCRPLQNTLIEVRGTLSEVHDGQSCNAWSCRCNNALMYLRTASTVGTITLKLQPRALEYLSSRLQVLSELENLRASSPSEFFRGAFTDLDDYTRLQKLQHVLQCARSIRIQPTGNHMRSVALSDRPPPLRYAVIKIMLYYNPFHMACNKSGTLSRFSCGISEGMDSEQ